LDIRIKDNFPTKIELDMEIYGKAIIKIWSGEKLLQSIPVKWINRFELLSDIVEQITSKQKEKYGNRDN